MIKISIAKIMLTGIAHGDEDGNLDRAFLRVEMSDGTMDELSLNVGDELHIDLGALSATFLANKALKNASAEEITAELHLMI